MAAPGRSRRAQILPWLLDERSKLLVVAIAGVTRDAAVARREVDEVARAAALVQPVIGRVG